jgi:hypothetical protein
VFSPFELQYSDRSIDGSGVGIGTTSAPMRTAPAASGSGARTVPKRIGASKKARSLASLLVLGGRHCAAAVPAAAVRRAGSTPRRQAALRA